MWSQDKKAPVMEFLGWTFLINLIGFTIGVIGERTGILIGGVGGAIHTFTSTFIDGASPLYATYIILRRHSDIANVREFAKRILYTSDMKMALGVTAAYAAAILMAAILAGERTASPWYLFIPAVPLMILGGGYEEVGWRGFLQPELEKRMPFIPAVLITTLVWFAWHLPLWFISFTNQSGFDLLPYALQLTANSFALAAIYKLSKSTIACILFHAWGNAIGAIFEWRMFATFPIDTVLRVYYCFVIGASIILGLSTSRKEKNTDLQNPA